MITQIADHFGFGVTLVDSPQVPGKNKLDMAALIQQGMIMVKQDYYSLMCQKVHVLDLPAYDFISITNRSNWLYDCPDPEEGDEDLFDSFTADEPMDGASSTEEPYFQQPPEPTQASGSYSMPSDQWGWIQDEIGHLRTKQSRQGEEITRFGAEQRRQGTVLDEMNAMMQRMMLHYPYPPPPHQ